MVLVDSGDAGDNDDDGDWQCGQQNRGEENKNRTEQNRREQRRRPRSESGGRSSGRN